MHRFFVSPSQVQQDKVYFSPEQARQMATVLRLRQGHDVLVLDNTGLCYRVQLGNVTPASAFGEVQETGQADGEPQVRITLFQALLKGQKWEYLLQKGTEVGISDFVPTLCQRSVSRYDQASWESKLRRWQTILKEAAEQSGRGRLPVLHAPMTSVMACQSAEGLGVLAYEEERETSLREVLASSPTVSHLSLYVGPEGGFTQDEVALARQHGIRVVSLGRRILRAETAGVIASAAILYALGDLG